jgi:hypothetical protein
LIEGFKPGDKACSSPGQCQELSGHVEKRRSFIEGKSGGREEEKGKGKGKKRNKSILTRKPAVRPVLDVNHILINRFVLQAGAS